MIIDDFKDRGLLSDVTGEDELRSIIEKEKISLYCGFDPTADSLHVGSLLPLINMRRFIKDGHNVIALIGGATGFIGDPSFKSEERKLNNADTIDFYKKGIEKQINFILGDKITLVDNLSWTKDLNVLDFLRDVGKHFSVNTMLNKESVKQRINRDGEGISFTEFSYQLLQGMDFLKLKEKYNCILQIGGSDQMGNITSGTNLIHKTKGNNEPAFGLTTKLLTKADGTKFGKSELGTVWLSKEKTSIFEFFQFWLKTKDSDVYDFLLMLSEISVEDIEKLKKDDESRKPMAQEILAKEMTILVHGKEGLEEALKITDALMKEDFSSLNKKEIEDIKSGLSNIDIKESNISLLDALVNTGLSKSRRESREFISNGSIKINGMKITDIDFILEKKFSINDVYFIKRGKRNLSSISFV